MTPLLCFFAFVQVPLWFLLLLTWRFVTQEMLITDKLGDKEYNSYQGHEKEGRILCHNKMKQDWSGIRHISIWHWKLGKLLITACSDYYFHIHVIRTSVCPYIYPYFFNKLQVKTTIATCGTVGLIVGIIDDTHLLIFLNLQMLFLCNKFLNRILLFVSKKTSIFSNRTDNGTHG